MKILKRLSTALFLMMFAVSAFSTDLTGLIEDQEAEFPLAGANVLVRNAQSGQFIAGTATDADGKFTLSGLANGKYELVITYVGYSDKIIGVTVADQDENINITLSQSDVMQSEVVVVGNRARARVNPITISNLSARDLEERSSAQDLPSLLAEMPSITYHSDNGNGIGYNTLRMRGFDQRRFAVLVNGIPQNDPEDHNVYFLNFFDLQGSASDIQVQRGAGASFYGPAAIGGAINIVALPYRPKSYVQAHVGYGSFNTQRYSLELNSGTINKNWIFYGRFSRLTSDGYRDWSWSKFNRFFAGVAYNGDNHTVTLQAYGGPQEDGLSYYGISKADNEDDTARKGNFAGTTKDVEKFHQPHFELLHDWKISDKAVFSQSIFYVRGYGNFDFDGRWAAPIYLRLPESVDLLPGASESDDVGTALGVTDLQLRAFVDNNQVGWLPRLTIESAAGQTMIGAEARYHQSLHWGRVEEASAEFPQQFVGADNDYHHYEYKGQKMIASVYANHFYKPSDRIAIQGDLQITWRQYRIFDELFVDNDFKTPYIFVNPRLGITFNPGQSVSGYVSAALAQREPRLKQLYDADNAAWGTQPAFEVGQNDVINFDNPLVNPERLLDFEAGASVLKHNWRASANVYWMEFSDEIVKSGGLDRFGQPRTGNAERSRHVGIEIEAAVRLFRSVDLSGNVTYSQNKFIDFVEFIKSDSDGDGNGDPLDRSGNTIAGFPDLISNVRLAWRPADFLFALTMQSASRQFVDNSNARPDPNAGENDEYIVDPYALMNLSTSWSAKQTSPLSGLTFGFEVNNVLNQKVLLYGQSGPAFFPIATRNVFASLRYTFK